MIRGQDVNNARTFATNLQHLDEGQDVGARGLAPTAMDVDRRNWPDQLTPDLWPIVHIIGTGRRTSVSFAGNSAPVLRMTYQV